jgi:hypothetical protein
MEDGLERSMLNYTEPRPAYLAQKIYLCILTDTHNVKKYILTEHLDKAQELTKNPGWTIEICMRDNNSGYYESTGSQF